LADDEALPPPLEVPWQLASTTQPLAAGDPDETTISVFSFEPDDEELTNLFPDERLIVNARLRRVCVLDDPPGPLTFVPFDFLQHLGWLLSYVDRAYPVGTPLEELDIDLFGLLPQPVEEFIRPVLAGFLINPVVLLTDVISPSKDPLVLKTTGPFGIAFKLMLELWLETQRDEYERDAARSPLERGVLLGEDRVLDTCFTLARAAPQGQRQHELGHPAVPDRRRSDGRRPGRRPARRQVPARAGALPKEQRLLRGRPRCVLALRMPFRERDAA
jgi:hypothetical protein